MKLTQAAIAKLLPRETGRFAAYDDALPGFGVMVQPTGAKSFVAEYRPAGAGRSAAKRRVTIGAVGKVSLDDARKEARRLFAEVAKGADPMAQRREAKAEASLSDMADRWLTYIERTKKLRSHEEYRRAMDLHIKPVLGTKAFRQVARADVRRLFDKLSTTSPVVANRVLAIISSMWGWVAAQEMVSDADNPTRRIERNAEHGRERYLNDEELSRLGATLRLAERNGLPWVAQASDKPESKHLAKPENRRTIVAPDAVAAIRLLLLTSCRLREILHLRWDEVDLDRGVIRLAHDRAKAGKRDVPLSTAALDVLSGIPKLDGNPHVFAGANGKPRSDLNKPWAAVTTHAGLVGLRIHDLRHTSASSGAGAGLSLHTIGGLLGHRSTVSTARYSHLDANPLRRAADTVATHLQAAMGETTREKTHYDSAATATETSIDVGRSA